MPQRIFVTGTGMICALGQDVEHALFSLRNSVSGIGELRHIETIHKKLPFGEVKFSDEDLIQMAGITSLQQKFSRTALLGIIAATEAVKGKPFLQTERVGIVSATTVGGMPLNEKYYKELLKEDSTATFIESLDCTENTEQIADRLNIRHYLATISTACSSSANAIMVGARLLKHNRVDKVLVGGTDALTRFTLNGFNSLEILSNQPCKPFDEYRNGTTIGEGAGFLLLETEQTADPANIICEIAGYGNANDAYHITAPSPDGSGSYLAMKRAFESAQNNPFEIDYVNAHGTGTPLNDMSEIIAMENWLSPGL